MRIASFERGYRFSDLLSNKEIHILLNALSKIRTVLHDGRLVQEYGGNHNQRPRVLHHLSRNALDFTVHGLYVKRLSESDRSSTCPRQASENGSFGWRRCPRSAQVDRKILGILVVLGKAIEDDGAAFRRFHLAVLPNRRGHISRRQVKHEGIEPWPASEEMRKVEETRGTRC